MTKAKHALRLHVFIGNNTHQRRHENRYNTLNGIEPRHLGPHPCFSKIIAHACEVCSPDSEFQEIHHCQTKFNVHIVYRFWFNTTNPFGYKDNKKIRKL